MRLLVLLFSILLVACSKPKDPKKSLNPIYSSVELIDNGSPVSCVDCVMLEIQDVSVRISYGSDTLDECSGQGSAVYTSGDEIEFPDDANTLTTWVGNKVTSNIGSCHLSNANIELRWIISESPEYFDFTINGRVYKIKKLN